MLVGSQPSYCRSRVCCCMSLLPSWDCTLCTIVELRSVVLFWSLYVVILIPVIVVSYMSLICWLCIIVSYCCCLYHSFDCSSCLLILSLIRVCGCWSLIPLLNCRLPDYGGIDDQCWRIGPSFLVGSRPLYCNRGSRERLPTLPPTEGSWSRPPNLLGL